MSESDQTSQLPPNPVASNLDPSRGKWALYWLAGALALAVAHFAWLGAHLAPAIMSPDANGYVVQARLIAEQGRTWFSPTSPVQYVGMHWLETADGIFHSRYPAGLPLLQAGAWKFGGLSAALWLNPLLASATVFLTFLLARRFVAGAYAWLAAAVVATVSVTNQHALDADAHVAAAAFLVGGIVALVSFGENRRLIVGLLAGVLLGTVPAIRYPEAVVGLAIAVWLFRQIRPVGQTWPAILGALLPLGALGVHNTAAYGAFWRTGYALTGEQTGFGLRYFFPHAIPYLQALSGQGLALLTAFGLAGLAALAAGRRHRAEGLLFTGLVVPLVLVYMAYYFGGAGPGGAGGNLRFLIPVFPFLTVAGVWLLAEIGTQLGGAGKAAALAVAVLQLLVGLGSSLPAVTSAQSTLRGAARVRMSLEKEVPAGSVLIVDRQLAESLDAAGRWKLVEESMVAGLARGGLMAAPGPGFFAGGPGAGREESLRRGPGGWERPDGGMSEDDPSPMQRGKNRAQRERYAGLRPAERTARLWADVRAWAGDKPVYWLARSLDLVDNVLPEEMDYRKLAAIEAPVMMGPGGGGGMAPGRGGPLGAGRGQPGTGGPRRNFGAGGNAGPMGIPPAFVPGEGMPGGLRGGAAFANETHLRLLRLEWPKR